jgi:hypothetical protein
MELEYFIYYVYCYLLHANVLTVLNCSYAVHITVIFVILYLYFILIFNSCGNAHAHT